MEEIARCIGLEPSTWLIIGPNVPQIVYYTQLSNLIISFFLAFFVLSRGRRALPNQAFFLTVMAFAAWIFFSLMYWATNRADVAIFAWSIDILVEPLVHIGAFYLLYVLLEKKNVPFSWQLGFAIMYVPIPLLLATPYTLSGMDLATCLANEGPIALYYTYIVEIFATLCLVIFAANRYLVTKVYERRLEVLYLSAGSLLLLLAFSWGNITGSFTDDWELGQYGLFGMPVFIGFLVYSIVRFRTFNIKLIGTQALVVALWFALGAVLFVGSIDYVRVIVSLTLILFLVVGMLLVKSVKQEVESRERIEVLARDLAAANERLKELDQLKSEFISLASHQLRSPLTSMKGYASLILEGSFGKPPPAIEQAVQKIFDSSKHLVLTVEDFLNVSRIEQGKMKYEFTKIDLRKLVRQVVDQFMPTAKLANITLKYVEPEGGMYEAVVDSGKIEQVFSNLIDNSIKYTPLGTVTVGLSKSNGKIHFEVKDTGVGIPPETMPHLFQKFSRASDASKVNILGTGLGLYVVKQLLEAHGGKVWAESEGKGKGSRFIVELNEAPVRS